MALKGNGDADTGQSVGIVLPKKPSAHETRHNTSSDDYNWPARDKKLLILAVGLDESIYPAITSCKGEKAKSPRV